MLAALLAATTVAAGAQSISVDLGEGGTGGLTSLSLQLFALVTILALVPGLAITVTCFPFVVTVLSILRQAIGLQQSPPNMLIVSLAMFLSYFVMEPVFMDAWESGVEPYSAGTMQIEEAARRSFEPFERFMAARAEPETLQRLLDVRAGVADGSATAALPDPVPLSILVPGFLLTEIKRAFQIGFLIFLPFLIIDLAVAAILMSMGMMMVPPSTVSLPFKLAFFVVADGWTLVSQALVTSYM